MTRVLVVEDSATQAKELRLILESEGYEVETAPDGSAGFELLARGAFDLVLTDIVMPSMSGYELCRELKNDVRTRELPVIIVTTLSDPMDIIQGLECGADNFVTKPYEPDHLLARIATILESRRLRREGMLRVGVEILFMGKKFLITSDKQQVLDLLVSTFEDVVRKNRELVGSKTALEAANKELETFSYSVSHDLRAPLRTITSFSQILVEEHGDKLDERGREHLARVQEGARRMAELIDDLLQLARVTRTALQKTSVDLTKLARVVAAELRETAPDRAVEFVIQDGLSAIGDAKLLRVVFDNLLGNAWKFTARVAARIEVGSSHGASEPVYYIRDNGAGFDMKFASNLFGPFQRLHSDADFAGTGIGLATVQRIIHRHGGRIWAEGMVGRGATIHFTLPA
jgi:two-component system sensor histidine kinase/response regulator